MMNNNPIKSYRTTTQPKLTQSHLDKLRLQSLEKMIEYNFKAFYEVGMALKEIRDRRLYKMQGYRRFKDYCVERWDMGSRYAYLQIESSIVVENLRSCGAHLLPSSERQVRPLTKIKPQQQSEVWDRVLERAEKMGLTKISTKLVEEVVGDFTGKTTNENQKPSELPTDQILLKILLEKDTLKSFNKSLQRIRQMLERHGIVVSKDIVIEALLQVALQELENQGEKSLVVTKMINRFCPD
jgi:hypothetical protein